MPDVREFLRPRAPKDTDESDPTESDRIADWLCMGRRRGLVDNAGNATQAMTFGAR